MIQIKGKPKKKVLKLKEQEENEKLLMGRIGEKFENKFKNAKGGKFGDALQSLMGNEDEESEEQK